MPLLLFGGPAGKRESRLFPHHGRHLFCGNAFCGARPRYGQHFLFALENDVDAAEGNPGSLFLSATACQELRSVARQDGKKGKRKRIVRLGAGLRTACATNRENNPEMTRNQVGSPNQRDTAKYTRCSQSEQGISAGLQTNYNWRRCGLARQPHRACDRESRRARELAPQSPAREPYANPCTRNPSMRI